MTVKELKKALGKFPDNMEVFVGPRLSEFTYGLLNSVDKRKVTFHQIPGDNDIEARVDCVILCED